MNKTISDDEYFVYRKDGNLWTLVTSGPHLDVTVAVSKENSKKQHTHLQIRDQNGAMLYEFNNGIEY